MITQDSRRCPTCESTVRAVRNEIRTETDQPPYLCDDSWHNIPETDGKQTLVIDPDLSKYRSDTLPETVALLERAEAAEARVAELRRALAVGLCSHVVSDNYHGKSTCSVCGLEWKSDETPFMAWRKSVEALEERKID